MRSTNDASSACFNSSLTLCWAGFASADSGRDAGLAAGPPSDPELAGTRRQYRTSIPYLQEEEPEVSRSGIVRPVDDWDCPRTPKRRIVARRRPPRDCVRHGWARLARRTGAPERAHPRVRERGAQRPTQFSVVQARQPSLALVGFVELFFEGFVSRRLGRQDAIEVLDLLVLLVVLQVVLELHLLSDQ